MSIGAFDTEKELEKLSAFFLGAPEPAVKSVVWGHPARILIPALPLTG